jgi:diguanylate cyclase (GGDEF)-like protein
MLGYILAGLFAISSSLFFALWRRTKRELAEAGDDFLTGLPLRKKFTSMAELIFRTVKSRKFTGSDMFRRKELRDTPAVHDLTVMMFDIDHFKTVNDTWGHDMGDKVLEGLGAVLRRMSRSSDLYAIGRWGGEEFIAVLSTDLEGARLFYQRVAEAFAEVTVQLLKEKRTLSCGAVELVVGTDSLSGLRANADELLYEAKASGRNKMLGARAGETVSTVKGI